MISIIGAECTGKSTLAVDLATAIDAFIVPEELRAFVNEHRRAPRRGEQRAIAAAQRYAERQAQRAHARVIADPAPFMTAIYSLAYFSDASLIPQCTTWLAPSRLIVWCRPDIPWVADPGQRDGPQARTAVDRILEAEVARLRGAGMVVHEARGSRADRLASAYAALKGPGPQAT